MAGARPPATGRSLPPASRFLIPALFLLLAGNALGDEARTARFLVVYEEGLGGRLAARRAALDVRLELPDYNAVSAEMTPQEARLLARQPGVASVELDPPRFPMAQTVPAGITLVQAREIAPGPDPVTVCIIDSGFDLGHPDLATTGVSGFGDDWNRDRCGHGTHVAGIVAARDNRKGVVGVSPGVSLYVVNVFDDCAIANASDVIAALGHCRDAGAKVVNLSLGCTGDVCRSNFEEMVFEDLSAEGILSVAAAGNDGTKLPSYPASYDSVVSVAAVDANRKHAPFSQRNAQVELSAPGVDVLSTLPRGTGYAGFVKLGKTTFEGFPMEGSPRGKRQGPLVDCGLGGAPCPGEGGHICLIERGQMILFSDKVLACEASGGAAAIIYNNVPGPLIGTLGDAATSIPSLGIPRSDGLTLLENLGRTVRVRTRTTSYGYLSGTSMATPHVAGVAALLWSHDASWTAEEIRSAMRKTARDLGRRRRDPKFGYGLVQAADALERLRGQEP